MTTQLVPLFDRLPEIHRTRDAEADVPDQLRKYLGLIDAAFAAIHDDIWRLYDDLFVETASDWAVPYIGDLLGTSHLSGDPWTIRADVADTIALRRRKGTLAAVELLTFDLTGWGVHAVELRDRLAWSQHLNHIRPDRGEAAGVEPPGPRLAAPQRGGTVTLRDPALLTLLGTPFDPFAHLPDVRPPTGDATRYNLPNLAVFLWRLVPYRVSVTAPGAVNPRSPGAAAAGVTGSAGRLVAVGVDPLGRPVQLFHAGSRSKSQSMGCCVDEPTELSSLTELDEAPGPMLPARLTDDTEAGNPKAYVRVETYDPDEPAKTLDVDTDGLTIHLPESDFEGDQWQFRGANLCAWEDGLDAPLLDREIAIDPLIGRLLIGVKNASEAKAVKDDLLVTYTYGAPGPVGAHPIDREAPPKVWDEELFGPRRRVLRRTGKTALQDALADLAAMQDPLIVEIEDSMVHDLDLAAVSGTTVEAGGPNLLLSRTLILRAADGARPIVRLAQPLRVRPTAVRAATKPAQDALDARMKHLTLRLEGLFLTRGPGFPAGEPLIARAALNRLEIVDCTLDPGGFRQLDRSRAPVVPAIAVQAGHGFADAQDAKAFKETPEIGIERSISGAVLADGSDYTIDIRDSIVDAGSGPSEPAGAPAVSAATNPLAGWGAPLCTTRTTFLGPVRVETIEATGAIFAHVLAAHNDQTGCVRLSSLAGAGDRLPQNVESVHGPDRRPRFVSIALGEPGYGQLTRATDSAIRDRGPGDDEMGAYGSLAEAHKWRNLQVRYREFMPLGIRPLLIPVT
jgi:hypothetical protein